MYFKGLNGLRFFAAMLVVVTHVESIRKKLGYFHLSDLSFFQTGGLAVQFFFVLSGFLITFLLLQEQHNTQQISLKHFYLRRVFRIFPLYYLLAIIGLYVLPYVVLPFFKTPFQADFDLGTGSLLYFFFLPNLANSWFVTNHLYPLWSIGVEEQFYLLWAPLMKFFKKYFIKICVGIIFLKIGLNFYLHNHYPTAWFSKFIATLQFECMAIGGLGAWWIFYQEKKDLSQHVFFSKKIQTIVFLLLSTLIFFKINLTQSDTDLGAIWRVLFHPLTYPIVSSVLFLHLILNVSLNSNSFIKTEHRIFNFLGEISYGLYMYHILVVYVVIKMIGKFGNTWSPVFFTTILYSMVFGVLIAVCAASFRFFEKPLMKWKHRI